MGPKKFRTVCNRAGPIIGDPAEWPKIRLLNRDFGSILIVFPRKNGKTQSSLNFLQSGRRQFSKSVSSGLAPNPAGSEKSRKISRKIKKISNELLQEHPKKKPLWASPQKRCVRFISGKEVKKGSTLNFFQGEFCPDSKKGVKKGPFWATKIYCVSFLLQCVDILKPRLGDIQSWAYLRTHSLLQK